MRNGISGRITLLNITTVLFLVLGRLLVPTAIDLSVTSVYKDFAHIYFGVLLVYCWQTRHKGLIALTIGSALFELACALLKVGG